MKAKKKKLDHVEQTVEEKLAEERKEVEERVSHSCYYHYLSKLQTNYPEVIRFDMKV